MNSSEKGKWKSVSVDRQFLGEDAFSGFGGMQVLTDYSFDEKGALQLGGTTVKKEQKGKKLQKKTKGKTDVKQNGEVAKQSPNASSTETGQKKKKKNLRKRKKKPQAQVINSEESTTEKTNDDNDNNNQTSESDADKKTDVTNKTKPNKNKNKNKKKALMNKRMIGSAQLIDITDVDKHVPLGEQIVDVPTTKAQKRKLLEDDDPKNKKKARKNNKKDKQKKEVELSTKPIAQPTAEPDAVQDGPKKKKARKNKKKNKQNKVAEPNTKPTEPDTAQDEKLPKKKVTDMSKWKELFVPEPVLQALSEVGFEAPTPIQCLALPSAIRDRLDILGAAETGSGKTLAFGIPMIHNILQYRENHKDGETSDDDQDMESDFDSEGEEQLDMEAEFGNEEDDENDESGEDEKDDVESGEDEEEDDESGEDEDGIGKEEGDEEDDEDDESEIEFDEDGSELEKAGNEDEDEEIDDEDDEEDNQGSEDESEAEEEESDDGGEYDLAPNEDEEEEHFELKEDEMGCVAAFNNVDFSWMEGEDGMTPVDDLGDEVPNSNPPRKTAAGGGPLHGLILTPTRELAIQVKDHLVTALAHTDIKVCCIVGGMAAPKQERLLRRSPEIVVATPGRFWELLQGGDPHLAKVTRMRTLVIDEADRMVERGHFEELRSFFEFIKENQPNKRRRQTFVFSATLTMVHQAPVRLQHKKKRVKQLTADDKLQSLMEMVGINPKAKRIDITRKVGTAEMLIESKINCTSDEKDIYLYYFLKRYPGRTLVFSNSKDCLRRLVSIFNILECKPLPLHADMHQRQRLKNLDKFKADPKGLLLATDVAARGLDIPNVDHVIHYQVPRTSENYVHRSGRTARASNEGLSVVLVGQEDMTNYRKIIRTLNRSEELGVFPVEHEFMAAMKERMGLARRIDKEEHRTLKKRKENQWFEKAAKEMDMEFDGDELLNDMGDSHEQAHKKQNCMFMRRDLKTMLSQPVIPRAFSGRYPTKMGKLDLPLDSSLGGACAAVKKEAKRDKRINLSNVPHFKPNKDAKKNNKKKYKRKR